MAIIAASRKPRKPTTDYSFDLSDADFIKLFRILDGDLYREQKVKEVKAGALAGGYCYIQCSCESDFDLIAELKNSGIEVKLH